MTTFMQKARPRIMTDALVCLFTLECASKNILLRYTNNARNLVSNSKTFVAYPFTYVWPSSGGDELPEIRVTLNGADEELRASVLLLPTEKRLATITLQHVLASAPNTVLKECAADYYQSPGFETEKIVLVAGFTDTLGEPGNKRKQDTVHYPGIHAQGTHR